MSSDTGEGGDRRMRASQVLRTPGIWIGPALIASVLVFLMTLSYVGSVVNPSGHLHGLPVFVVDQDRGAEVSSGRVDLGREVVAALAGAHAVSSRLELSRATLAHAEAQMNRNNGYATIVIPPRFTDSVLALYGLREPGPPAPGLAEIQLLTNERAGSLGVGLATGVAEPALHLISRQIGARLAASAGPLASAGVGAPAAAAAARALRADPVASAAVPFNPPPPNSALGLSAFYIALLSILCGFVCAAIVHSSLDFELGYATSEVGPRWSQRRPAPITRWQTLLSKWLMAAAIVPLLTAVLLVVAIVLLGMNAHYVGYLWLFTTFAALVVAIGTLALLAALGSLGQLVAMLVFIYLALASSGGTVPVEALPGVLRFAANFEPLRQVLDGVRAILYFNAAGDAGLTRGFLMTGLGLVVWLAFGAMVTRWYDRKGFYRVQPDVIDYVNRSLQTYSEQAEQS